MDSTIRSLDRLVGTWQVSGGATGQVTYSWLPGGHFLHQEIDIEQDGHRVRGIEIIGREKPFGTTEPGADLKCGGAHFACAPPLGSSIRPGGTAAGPLPMHQRR